MKKTGVIIAVATIGLLQACTTNSPQQERQVGCAGAAVTGALVGGALGNQLGGGSGQDILTAGGAAAGAIAGNSAAGC